MRKFKRLIQKTAVAIAIGTAGISATAMPIISSVSVQAADTDKMAAYEAKAKEFEQWAEDKGYEIELVDLEEWEVHTLEEVEEHIQNFIDAYDQQMEEAIEGPVWLYMLNLTYSPDPEISSVSRTISLEDTEGNKLADDVIQTGGDFALTIYKIDGTSISKTAPGEIAAYQVPWDEYTPEEIEGYKVKSTENTGRVDRPAKDGTGKVVYEKTEEEEPGGPDDPIDEDIQITDEDTYKTALEKLKKYAEKKGVEPKIENFGDIESSSSDGAIQKEKELIESYKQMIENGEDPVIYTGQVWWDISEWYERTISFEDEDGNTITGTPIQDVQVQRAYTSQGTGQVDFTENEAKETADTGTSDPKWEAFEAPNLVTFGYTFVRGENIDEKVATQDEEGKCIYKKTKNDDENDVKFERVNVPENVDDSWTKAYDTLKDEAAKKYQDAIDAVLDKVKDTSIEVKTVEEDEKKVTPSELFDIVNQRIAELETAYNAINNGESTEPVIHLDKLQTPEISETMFRRTISFKDKDGNKLQDDVIQKQNNGSQHGNVRLEVIKSDVDLAFLVNASSTGVGTGTNYTPQVPALTPPEIDGYEVESTDNIDEKTLNKDETGSVIYKKAAESRDDSDIEKMSLTDIIKEIKNAASKNGVTLNETKADTETGKASEKDAKEKEYKDYYADVLKALRDAVDNKDKSFDVVWKTFEGKSDVTTTDVARTITFEFQNDSTMKRDPIVQSNSFSFSAPDVVIDTQKGLIGEDTSENKLVVYPKVNAPEIDGWELLTNENTDEIKIEYKATDNQDTVTSKVNKTGKFVYKKKASPTPPTPVDPTPTDPTPVTPTPTDPTPAKQDPVTVTASNASKYGLSEDDFKRAFVRIIQFVLDDGTQAASPVTQTVVLERTALYDPNTGNITYANWNSGSFGAVTVPVIAGYEAGVSSIAETPVDVNAEILDEIVTYYRTDEFVDNPGEVIEDAYIDESYTTPIEYLDELPEYGYETDYIGEIGETPDTGNVSAIGGIIGLVASGAGLVGTSIFSRKKEKK